MTRKQPAAITAAIQLLAKLGADHGADAVHHVYAEAISDLMANRERDVWRTKIAEAQRDTFALIEGY